MSDQPNSARVRLYNVEYTVDLEACRVRMLERVAELKAGQVAGFHQKGSGGLQLIAKVAGVDRTTLRRFLRGERMTVETFTAIVTRGLRLDMKDVIRKAA